MSGQPPGRDAGNGTGGAPPIRLSHALDESHDEIHGDLHVDGHDEGPADWGGDDSGVFDALTDVFLGHDDGPEAPEKTRPIEVEALALGHLPVMASAWVSQYARHAARADGSPVALVKLRGGRVTVELHGDAGDVRGGRGGLEDALRLASAHAGRWLVRVDEADEAELGSRAGIDRVTVLSSTEKTAVVACYNALKAMTMGEKPPAVRVAVLDAGDGRAEIAIDKLRRASEAFLPAPIEGEQFEGRIGRGRSVTLFDGPVEIGLAGLLARLPRSAAEVVLQPERVPEPVVALRAEPEPEPEPELMIESEPMIEQVIEPEPAHWHRPMAVQTQASLEADVLDPAPAASNGSAAVLNKPEPEPEPEPQPEPAGPALLSDRVGGLIGLPARCPFARHVELAAGGDGVLHLLVECEPEAVSEAVETIESVRTWAQEHAELLALACPQLTTGTSVTHLFTGDPRRVRRLLDGSIRLHLLARAEQVVRDGWVCAELN